MERKRKGEASWEEAGHLGEAMRSPWKDVRHPAKATRRLGGLWSILGGVCGLGQVPVELFISLVTFGTFFSFLILKSFEIQIETPSRIKGRTIKYYIQTTGVSLEYSKRTLNLRSLSATSSSAW